MTEPKLQNEWIYIKVQLLEIRKYLMNVLRKWNIEKMEEMITEISEIHMNQNLSHFPVHLSLKLNTNK